MVKIVLASVMAETKAQRRRRRHKEYELRSNKTLKAYGVEQKDRKKGELTPRQLRTLIGNIDNNISTAELQHRSPIIWVVRNVYTEKGEQMDFHDRPYLVDIYKDFTRNIVVKKGSQIGLTQLSIAKSLYLADTRPMTIIYTFPTATDVSVFSRTRFKTIMSNSQYLTNRIRDSDSAGVKTLGESTILFKGAHKETQGISIPSDLNIHDELDFSDQAVIDVFASRLPASKYKWTWFFSTPTLPKFWYRCYVPTH